MPARTRVLVAGLGAALGVAGCFEDTTTPPEGDTGQPGTSSGAAATTGTDAPGTTSDGPSSSTDAADDTSSESTTTTTSAESTGPSEICGDGIIDGNEECDGEEWAGASCESLGLVPGQLACSESCTFDLSGCTPPGMVLVEGGPFEMGSNDYPEEQPIRRVEVSTFYIDVHEVTAAQYAACVDDGACVSAGTAVGCNYLVAGREDHPINCVDPSQAEAYCGWVDGGVKRLPTEAEWEKAARGTDARRYPWGDAPLPSCTHLIMNDGGQGCGQGSTWMVGSRPMGESAHGGLDMAGNVWEWVSDWYAKSYEPADTVDPVGPATGSFRVLRGGGWFHSAAADFTVTHRHEVLPDLADPYIGFRCVQRPPG